MPLALLVGPANAGKVARLLDRYLDCLDREPVLVVPNRFDRDRVERDLLGRTDALLGGLPRKPNALLSSGGPSRRRR